MNAQNNGNPFFKVLQPIRFFGDSKFSNPVLRGALLFVALWLPIIAAKADDQTISRQILLPDGSSAAAVNVLLRRPAQQGDGYEDKWLQTDSKGVLTLETVGGIKSFGGFAMIDAPGCALDFWTSGYLFNEPLRLKRDVPWHGIVIDSTEQPVKGAFVSARAAHDAMGLSSVLMLNDMHQKWKLPQLATETGAHGEFTLRSISYQDITPSLSVFAQAKRGSNVLLAEANLTATHDLSRAAKGIKLKVEPLVKIRGRVINSVTKAPLEDAVVSPSMQLWAGISSNVTTMKNGRFSFDATPLDDEWKIYINKSGFTDAIATLSRKDLGRINLDNTYEVTIALHPKVAVRGRVIDPETNLPPLLRTYVVSTPEITSTKQGAFSTIEQASAGGTQTDGSFEMRSAAGNYRLSAKVLLTESYGCLAGIAQKSPYRLESSKDVIIGKQGLNDVTLYLRKNPGVLIYLERSKHNVIFGMAPRIEIRSPEGKITTIGNGYPIFVSTPEWGDKFDIRVLLMGEEILPWTSLVANKTNWPVTLKIPEQNPTPALQQLLAP